SFTSLTNCWRFSEWRLEAGYAVGRSHLAGAAWACSEKAAATADSRMRRSMWESLSSDTSCTERDIANDCRGVTAPIKNCLLRFREIHGQWKPGLRRLNFQLEAKGIHDVAVLLGRRRGAPLRLAAQSGPTPRRRLSGVRRQSAGHGAGASRRIHCAHPACPGSGRGGGSSAAVLINAAGRVLRG